MIKLWQFIYKILSILSNYYWTKQFLQNFSLHSFFLFDGIAPVSYIITLVWIYQSCFHKQLVNFEEDLHLYNKLFRAVWNEFLFLDPKTLCLGRFNSLSLYWSNKFCTPSMYVFWERWVSGVCLYSVTAYIHDIEALRSAILSNNHWTKQFLQNFFLHLNFYFDGIAPVSYIITLVWIYHACFHKQLVNFKEDLYLYNKLLAQCQRAILER